MNMNLSFVRPDGRENQVRSVDSPPVGKKAAVPAALLLLAALLVLSSCVDYKSVHSVLQAVSDFTMFCRTEAARLLSLPITWDVHYSDSFENSVSGLARSVFAMLVGCALTASGGAFQGLFKNPVVSPTILGVSSAASVGMALSVLLFNAYAKDFRVYVVCFAFGFGCVLLVILIAKVAGKGSANVTDLLLVGAVLSSLFSGIFSAVVQAIPQELTAQISSYLLGAIYIAPAAKEFAGFLTAVFAGLLPLLLLRYRMNILSFGDEEAQALGVNTGFLRIVIILCATLLTVSTVVFCGIIGWVGLVAPHIGRMLTGPDFNTLLPVSMLAGGIVMLAAEDLSILLGYFPLGIITSILGAPLFFYLLAGNRRNRFEA